MNPGNGDGNSHKTRPTISWDSDAVRNPLPKRSELPDSGNREKTTAPGAFPCRVREPAVWCDRNGDPARAWNVVRRPCIEPENRSLIEDGSVTY